MGHRVVTRRDPKPASDSVSKVKELLLWARRERIAMQHVTIGDVSVVVTLDHRMQHVTDEKPGDEARRGILEQFGGPLFNPDQRPPETRDQDNEPTEEDEDD